MAEELREKEAALDELTGEVEAVRAQVLDLESDLAGARSDLEVSEARRGEEAEEVRAAREGLQAAYVDQEQAAVREVCLHNCLLSPAVRSFVISGSMLVCFGGRSKFWLCVNVWFGT